MFPCLLVLTVTLTPQMGRPQPLPEGAVSGTTLSVSELNFSVDAPGTEWEWLETETENKSQRRFVCQNAATGGRLEMMVFAGNWEPFDEQGVKDFVAGSSKSWRDEGWRVDEVIHEQAALQSPHAHRYQYRLTSSDGATLYWFGYSVTAGRLYAFHALSDEAGEPPVLTQMVQSFRLLGPAPGDPAERFGQTLMFVHFLFLGMCGLTAWIVNRISGRPRWNGWRFGMIGIVVLSAVWAVYFLTRLPDDLTPFRQGEVFGLMVLGPAFLPLALAWFLSWRFRKRALAAASEP